MVAVLDVVGKVALLALLALVVIDPSWGNLAGKAPTARGLTYPLLAFAVPAWWVVRRPGTPHPCTPPGVTTRRRPRHVATTRTRRLPDLTG